MRRLLIHGGPVHQWAPPGWIEPGYVLVEDDRITGLGAGDPPRSIRDNDAIDLDGRYLFPGLVDSHFHLVSRSAAEVDEGLIADGLIEGMINAVTRLAGGITSVRDCGCRHHGIHRLRRVIDSGRVPGPRSVVAGRNPTSAAAPDHWRNVVADGPDGIAAAVGHELEAGADFVKLILSHAEDPGDWAAVARYLGEAELQSGVAAAHARGARVGVHCEGWEAARLAVDAGVDVLDHAPLLDRATADAMAARGAVYVPTIWAFSADSGLSESGTGEVARWQEEHRRSVRRARQAGVTIAAGSDAAGSLPAADVLVDEMQTLVAAGLTSTEALAAATTGGAAAIGVPGAIGTIAVGARADFVVLEGDPALDLDVLRRPVLVVARGRIFDPARLRAEWTEVLGKEPDTGYSTARWAHA